MNNRDLWVLGPPSPQVDTAEYILRACGEEVLYALNGLERTSWWDGSGWDGQWVRLVDADSDRTPRLVTHYPNVSTRDFRQTLVAAVIRYLARTWRLNPALLVDVSVAGFPSDPAGLFLEAEPGVWRITYRRFEGTERSLLVGTLRPEVLAPVSSEENARSQTS